MFYTNVSQYGNFMLYIGYDNDGNRVQKKVKYKPHLFVPAKSDTSKYRTLENKVVDRIDFDSLREAKDFVAKYEDIANFSIYGMPRWKYAFMSDIFPNDIDYKYELIRAMTIDIEVHLPRGGFDSFVETASEAITAITIRVGDKIKAFGYKEDYSAEGVEYFYCRDEEEMLMIFLREYEYIKPDVITGWNVEFFDMPYLINRIAKVFGMDHAQRISPWGILFKKSVEIYGRQQEAYNPLGVSILDYLQLYKKFTYKQQESYSLDYISQEELGEQKVDYSEYGNLDGLYEADFHKYMTYNIHDVNLVHKLDEKLQLLNLVYTLAYDIKINYNDALGKVLPWEIAIYNFLKEQNVVFPFKTKHRKDTAYEGAYVKEPIVGLHDWVMSFDLTSLYPHLIIMYNISPETFIRKEHGVNVERILHGEVENTSLYCMSANGCLYDRVRHGFLPALMKKYFAKRKDYKNKMLELKKHSDTSRKVQNEIAKYDTAQMAMKIFLNSAYGAVGNQHFAFYDNDHAEAITLSGQLSIKWIERHLNNYLNERLKTDGKDYIVAMDTDSVYIRVGEIVDSFILRDASDTSRRLVSDKYAGSWDNFITDRLDQFARRFIEPEINKAYSLLAEKMKAVENAMVMKRESISRKAIWKAKKMYILDVIDNEGVHYEGGQLKIMGIEAVRSSVPAVCRNALKEAYNIIMKKDNETLIKFIEDFKEKFEKMSFEEVAFPRSVKGLNKYRVDGPELYAKKTPIHVKGSLLYNHHMRKTKKQFTPIYDGDKIKFAYLKTPNIIHDTVIATPGPLPKELGLDQYVDRTLQFEKTFLEPLKSITDVIGWKVEHSYSLEDFF